MATIAPTLPVTRSPRMRRAALAGLLLAVPVLVGLVLISRSGPHTAVPIARTAPGQPLLPIRPHTIDIAAHLSGGVTLEGTLAPAMPGPNILHVAARLGLHELLTAGHLTLTASMPGMAMAPIVAVLHRQGSGFTGTMRLPMFGDYVTAATLRGPAAQYSGTMTISVPLPHL